MLETCSWTKRDDLRDGGGYAGTNVSVREVKIDSPGAEICLEAKCLLWPNMGLDEIGTTMNGNKCDCEGLESTTFVWLAVWSINPFWATRRMSKDDAPSGQSRVIELSEESEYRISAAQRLCNVTKGQVAYSAA